MKFGRAIGDAAARLPAVGSLFRGLQSRARKLRIASKGAPHLEAALAELTVRLKDVTDKVDLLKSAADIPREWFDEYRTWKLENPIPARPLVSICVATYNRSNLLTTRCLQSLVGQTWVNLEIVVVGDCCTDDTARRVAKMDDPRIRFVNLSERGRYPSEPMRRWQVAGTMPMNHALSLCNGYFVTHLDDDDEHSPDRIEKLVKFAKEHDLDFVWHPFELEQKSGDWELRQCEEFRLGQVTTSSIFYRRWLTRIGWDVHAHLLEEPGDWNRLRKFKYLGLNCGRYPESLLRHYVEGAQRAA